ncbi:MAG TPA: M28 family peptidase [Spirochaetia bacterium]|nr:M28 family peptidase [Spirochaetia bacterium]HRV27642.1 M28 family peptidase [Spirochaetia bacterium]
MNIPAWFYRFIDIEANRKAILKEVLEINKLQFREVVLNTDTHLLVYPYNTIRKPGRKIKLLTAHYDRVPGTQGVLDNSCAVWQLLEYAASPIQKENIVIAFTDHEEIPHEGSAKEQGAFFLGKALASMGIEAPAIFCFDVTGHGDTVLIADTVQQVVGRYASLEPLQQQISLMSRLLLAALKKHVRCIEGYLPFGENLGFMLAGFPALEISIVPEKEAPRRMNDFSGLAQPHANTSAPQFWSYLHTNRDTLELITPEAFFIMQKVLACLGSMHLSK